MVFVTTLVDLTLARANLDTQEMAKIALRVLNIPALWETARIF